MSDQKSTASSSSVRLPLRTTVIQPGARGVPTTSMATLKGTSESHDSLDELSVEVSSTRTSKLLGLPIAGPAVRRLCSSPGARVFRRRRPAATSGEIATSAAGSPVTVIRDLEP
jgi:hypothetical protein